MQMDPRGSFRRMDRITREVTPTWSHRTVNFGGESFSPLPPLHPRLPLRQAAEAAWSEEHASTITLSTQPSRDTTVTMATTTTSPPAHSTLTHPHIRHRTPLTASARRRDVSGGEGSVAQQWLSRPADPQRGGHSLDSAPTTTPQDRHSTLTPWLVTKNMEKTLTDILE